MAEAPPPARPSPTAPRAPVALADYFRIPRVRQASFSHDERLVVYTSDAGGRQDVWVAQVQTPGRDDALRAPAGFLAPRQITHVDGFVHSIAFSPAEDKLLYEADRGGDELPHLYLTDAAGATPVDLVADDPAGARTGFVEWADDGRTFLYLSNRRDRQYMDLCEYDLARRTSQKLWESSGVISFAITSRNHRRFIVSENLSDVNSNLYLVERGRPAPVLLTPHQGDVLYEPRGFTRDARTLYYTSDEDREFAALRSMDLRTKASQPVLEDEWDVERGEPSRGWTWLVTVTNVDGTRRVVLKNARTGEPFELPRPDVPGVLVPVDFSKTDRYIAATLESDVSPVAMYVVDTTTRTATKLAEVLPESLRGREMVAGESVRIRSFDDRPVPAFVYRPPGAGPHPAIIDVHGGPTSQSRREFGQMRQYLVSKGWVVLVPNVRGSTGFGKTYMSLDNMDLGGGPLRDIVACKRWLVESAGVDADKVVVMGGSYGGYMALAAAAFTPGEFAAQVDYFGVSDLPTLVRSFPPYWAAFATFIYRKFGDPNNPEHAQYQHDRSPLNYVERIVTPLLVVQGENDPRVRRDQSDRVVHALQERGVPVHYLVIPGEGHGFSRQDNRLTAYDLTDRFLDRYIFGDTSIELP
jgi:dipeptidyl aminopeptidase/acylaminoacyl peptidase